MAIPITVRVFTIYPDKDPVLTEMITPSDPISYEVFVESRINGAINEWVKNPCEFVVTIQVLFV